jgi:hypothetical protein
MIRLSTIPGGRSLKEERFKNGTKAIMERLAAYEDTGLNLKKI